MWGRPSFSRYRGLAGKAVQQGESPPKHCRAATRLRAINSSGSIYSMKLNIRSKFLVAFGIMIVLMMAVFGAGYWGLNIVTGQTEEIATQELQEDIAVRELEVLILEQTATYQSFVITENEDDLTAIRRQSLDVYEHFDLLRDVMAMDDDDDELIVLLSIAEDEYVLFVAAGDALVSLVQESAPDETILIELELLEMDKRLLKRELDALAAAVEVQIGDAFEQALDAKSLAISIALVTLLASIVIGAALAIILSRRMSSGMGQLLYAAESIAQGELDQHVNVTSRDEVGDTAAAFATMTNYMREMADTADQIADGDLTVNVKPISERDRLGNAFFRMVNNLAERVQRRTAELQEANADLEAFSTTVAHTLRGPLQMSSALALRLLESDGDSMTETSKRTIELIAQSARESADLVTDLLEFARVGDQELIVERLDPGEIAAAAKEEFARDEPTVKWTLNEMPECYADRSLLRVVITNLLSNAYKFTAAEQEPAVEMGATEVDGALAYYVRDNGVGFDMDAAGRVFEVFERLHRPEDYPGTGAGLAIALRIIERHSGRIWAESEVGVGSTFYFTLPRTLG